MSNGAEHGWFRGFAEKTATTLGKPAAFLIAFSAVLVWALCGPYFRYSETWQMVINTGTTIITFLMVFLLQNTQARDSRALHLKLNELLRAVADARNDIVAVETLSDERLDELKNEYATLASDSSAGEASAEDSTADAK